MPINVLLLYMFKISFYQFYSIRKALENRTNMEDDRISLLETQLGQARLIAEESDKKYEEVSNRFLYMIIFFYCEIRCRYF